MVWGKGGLSARKAAEHFGVSHTTLSGRLDLSFLQASRRTAEISAEEEQVFEDWLLYCALRCVISVKEMHTLYPLALHENVTVSIHEHCFVLILKIQQNQKKKRSEKIFRLLIFLVERCSWGHSWKRREDTARCHRKQTWPVVKTLAVRPLPVVS